MGHYWGDGPRKPDLRGNVQDRRRRKRWLLDTFGDGTHAPCAHCGTPVSYSTIFVDRIVPGEQGGRYTRDNIQPSCERCSHLQGAAMTNGGDHTSFTTPV